MSEERTEVNLRSGKVLPPRMAPKENTRQVDASNNPVPPVQDTPPREEPVEVQQKVDYNVLAHLRKFPAKFSIFDALILSKEMRES